MDMEVGSGQFGQRDAARIVVCLPPAGHETADAGAALVAVGMAWGWGKHDWAFFQRWYALGDQGGH
jgi:hypothetical protein